jgi:cytochrome c-type biogenesis protein CcmE
MRGLLPAQEKAMTETQEALSTPPRVRLASRQIKWIVGGIVVAVAVGYLIFAAASGSAAYYMTIEELEERGSPNGNVRVAGNVVGESILWEPRDLRLEFDMVDESGRMTVVYKGSRPDMFRDEAELVVEGRLSPEGVFEARTLMLKCPSKYEEAD